MKICTITCHDVYNYGASLQAFALMHYLEMLGYEVEIIDYKPDYLSHHYEFWTVPPNSHYYNLAMKSNLIRFLLCSYLAKRKFETYGRVPKFKWFKKHVLKCTRRYNSYEELKNDPPIADIYIAGSDQIWNTNMKNGKDPAFYCMFGPSNAKRFAYAASFAIPEIQPELKETIKHYLSNLDAISVREKTGLKILESLNYSGTNVVDPVLLLDKEEWEKVIVKNTHPSKKPYIMIYDLSHQNPDIEKHAVELSKEKGWKIISINDSEHLKYADFNIRNAGPSEFLAYLKNAEYVISNSFHATALSTLFNRPFSCFYNKSNVSRISDFLELTNLLQCFNPCSLPTTFNWEHVNERLKDMRLESIEYINNSLNK